MVPPVCPAGPAGVEHRQVEWHPGDLLQHPGDPAGGAAALQLALHHSGRGAQNSQP